MVDNVVVVVVVVVVVEAEQILEVWGKADHLLVVGGEGGVASFTKEGCSL